jgi:hypothetical protein
MPAEDFHENEPLIDGVSALPSGDYITPTPSPELRDRVWRSTAAVVRARPRRRRIAFGCCVLAAYAAGMATVRIAGPAGGSREPGLPETAVTLVSNELGVPPLAQVSVEPLPPSPAALEAHLAALPRPERPRLLKQAGDRYLSEDLDLVNALYCYRRFLKIEERTPRGPAEPGETWFLQALRLARMQEVKREPKDG